MTENFLRVKEVFKRNPIYLSALAYTCDSERETWSEEVRGHVGDKITNDLRKLRDEEIVFLICSELIVRLLKQPVLVVRLNVVQWAEMKL